MINLFNAEIESMSIHKLGNKSRNEKLFLSNKPDPIRDELRPLLKEYFLKPFRDMEEQYFHFTHEVELEYNVMNVLAYDLFSHPDKAHEISRKIASHLFEQSLHPHIKKGELFVVYFKNVTLDNIPMDAIGIFKAEILKDFLQIEPINIGEDRRMELFLLQGTLLDKLDKGVLIFNCNRAEGYKILTVDTNKYDARYWMEHFLGVEPLEDEHYNTRKYLKFVQGFAKDVVFPAEDKREEVLFLNRSVNYFAKNDEFTENDFINEVIDNPELVPEFKNYKIEKGPKYSIEDLSTFPISNTAVTDARKKIKNVITLDTNIELRLDFINPESAEKFIEKGWDEERQMYYYLVYFNKEQK